MPKMKAKGNPSRTHGFSSNAQNVLELGGYVCGM